MIISKDFYSNCLLEALKAKLKCFRYIKILPVKSKDNLLHFMWFDKRDNNIYSFEQIYMPKHWINLLWFKGHIVIRSRRAYERMYGDEQEG